MIYDSYCSSEESYDHSNCMVQIIDLDETSSEEEDYEAEFHDQEPS